MNKNKTNKTVFFDTSVLISALISKSGASFLLLNEYSYLKKLTSQYCIEEVLRNINKFKNTGFPYSDLIKNINILEDVMLDLAEFLPLAQKDIPVLSSAVYYEADFLVTLDRKDFGIFLGKSARRTKILTPKDLLFEIRK